MWVWKHHGQTRHVHERNISNNCCRSRASCVFTIGFPVYWKARFLSNFQNGGRCDVFHSYNFCKFWSNFRPFCRKISKNGSTWLPNKVMPAQIWNRVDSRANDNFFKSIVWYEGKFYFENRAAVMKCWQIKAKHVTNTLRWLAQRGNCFFIIWYS